MLLRRNSKRYKEKSYHYQIYHCLKVKPSCHEKFFQKKKNYCYGFMPADFQVICGSMVGENRRSPASTEIPAPPSPPPYTLLTSPSPPQFSKREHEYIEQTE